MPAIKHMGSSEYQKKFKWLQSPKSATFSPSKEQAAPIAGQSSLQSSIPFEPPLQRKKKPLPIGTTATTKMFENGYDPGPDEYVLLGDQSKFAPSIKYRNLNNTNSYRPKAMAKTYKVLSKVEKKKLSDVNSAPVPKPAPRVHIDTGARQQPPAPREQPPAAPQTKPQPQPAIPKPKKADLPPKVRVDTGAPKPADPRDKRVGAMNEFVQTDMGKGVAESGQEAPEDYALKYRAGVPPPRPKGPKRKSEYQMQYEWKKPVEQGPLLRAEQIVYNSSPDLPPYKKDNIPRASEYASEFKTWQNLYKPVYPKNGGDTPRKKSKMKRSKSEAALSPDKRPPAGIRQSTSAEDKRLVKESANPQRIFFPHGKYKNYKSEYKMNFQAPSRYSYDQGAWKGANPPHLQQTKDSDSDQPATQPSWYNEVLELRKKADEYRKRALGTHFSREHLAQLLARQNQLWDEVSQSSSLSALSLESASRRPPPPPKKETRPVTNDVPVKRKLAWNENQNGGQESSSSIGSIRSPEGTLTSGSLSDTEGTLVDEDEGRVPTPRIRQTEEPYRRHHLDLTTPAVGGALLTSPPPRRKSNSPKGKAPREISSKRRQPAPQPSRPELMNGYDEDQSSYSSASSRPPANPRAELPASPTYGMPTRDTHALLDEDVDFDQPLETRYMHSPAPKARRDRPNSGSIHGRPMSAYPQKRDVNPRPAGVPSPLYEGMGKTYSKPTVEALAERDRAIPPPPSKDEDSLSTSIRSLASSCSLASEVLDRARNRRDEFWGKADR